MSPPSGPQLVVVPGLGLSTATVASTLAALSDLRGDVRTRCVCLPGYGQRIPPGARPTLSQLTNLLIAELDQQSTSSGYVLMGHSSSCQVVTEAAARMPERVRGLVLVGPTTDPRAVSWPALAMRWLATAMHEDPRQIPLLIRTYARTGLPSMKVAMDASRRHRIHDAIVRVRCPVLVVRGHADRIAPEDWIKMLGVRGRGLVVTLPVGAHMLPITHPRRLAATIAPMLNPRGPTAATPGVPSEP